MLRQIAAVAAFMTVAGAAGAQDFSLEPNFGEVSLASGFPQDPHTVSIISGGSVDSSATIGGSCAGFISDAPDFRLQFDTQGGLPLIFTVTSTGDTTLIVNDSNGEYQCDDDSAGNFNPQVTIANPTSGTYDVWIGSFTSGENLEATLAISEIATGPGPASDPGPIDPGTGGGMLDPSLEPNFGTVALQSGFTPDPHNVDIVSGGDIDAASVGNGCSGFVTSAPDFRLNFDTDGMLPLVISATSGGDTTLVINDSNGTYRCDDDSAGELNPRVIIQSPGSGTYDIWVGNFGGPGGEEATLSVSEFTP